jgi:hypothetical protein
MKNKKLLYNFLTTLFTFLSLASLSMIGTDKLISVISNFTVFAILARNYYLKEKSLVNRYRRRQRAKRRRAALSVHDKKETALEIYTA